MERTLLIHPRELDDAWVRQAIELRLDGLGLHPVGGAQAHAALEDMLGLFDDPAYMKRLETLESAGVRVTYEMHALRYLMPKSMLENNPDWRRTDAAGARVDDRNFCPSRAGALCYLSDSAEKLWRRLPFQPRRAALWLDDGQDAFCHCPRCKGLSPSDQQLIALQAILRGIRRVRPDATLAYLAYYETLPAPTRRDLREGLYLQFAPYQRDLTRPLTDPGSAENRSQTEHLHDLLGFFGTGGATALDYWYDNSLLSHYTKPPRRLTPENDVVRADRAFYASLGFQRISSFACYLGPDYRALYGPPDLSAFEA